MADGPLTPSIGTQIQLLQTNINLLEERANKKTPTIAVHIWHGQTHKYFVLLSSRQDPTKD